MSLPLETRGKTTFFPTAAVTTSIKKNLNLSYRRRQLNNGSSLTTFEAGSNQPAVCRLPDLGSHQLLDCISSNDTSLSAGTTLLKMPALLMVAQTSLVRLQTRQMLRHARRIFRIL